MNTGWLCPRCGRINAPFVCHCDCQEEFRSNITTGECNHQWELSGMNTGGSHYTCKLCGAHKDVPIKLGEYHNVSQA